MEADISIRRKTGHFYFALTRTGNPSRLSPDFRPYRKLAQAEYDAP
jgi:hypothetical protein